MTRVTYTNAGPALEKKMLRIQVNNVSWLLRRTFAPDERERVSISKQMHVGPCAFKLTIVFDLEYGQIWVIFRQTSDSPVQAEHSLTMLNKDEDQTKDLQTGSKGVSVSPCIHTALGWLLDGRGHSQILLDRGFLQEDTLFFDWEVTAAVKDASGDSCKRAFEESASKARTTNFEDLLSSGKFSDVVLVLKERQLLAHSQILAAQSPVFAAMLTHEMQEKQSKRIDMSEFDVDIVQKMLFFLYTGKLGDTRAEGQDNAEKKEDGEEKRGEKAEDDEHFALLDVAHKYQIQSLMDICAYHLSSAFSVENVAGRLMKADFLDIKPLKASCLEFIVKTDRNTAKMQQSKGFKILSKKRPHLAVEILAAAFSTPEELERPSKTRRRTD
eukprot:TRINITY_DN97833_c0_g1_i1.p1 TRINITY_DN97833_c0_g1~~TRINITY_DN97833_c0_g1_i1.p1  ORF type:complete len:384 (-),score=64.99 TRINITY_DN97833_c0_g1_i1:115-1266(-)